jgi:hypothetical protein
VFQSGFFCLEPVWKRLIRSDRNLLAFNSTKHGDLCNSGEIEDGREIVVWVVAEDHFYVQITKKIRCLDEAINMKRLFQLIVSAFV